jgi:hypothetical protein
MKVFQNVNCIEHFRFIKGIQKILNNKNIPGMILKESLLQKAKR